ncbi:PI-PLC X domain-containing protein 2 isoform X2 [Lethenteron reissneri]|uniref:PI-PLC X domain-containing protein 2 isoform X2 n=1 Tax=Lethenteron reissneri TaxID=7753 RepID=UPI002AB5F424|nr:PI-PLC X domain-containing protein 2 isoform X2 [Lethenteron reissneri]XP_061407446.1 PI-PLC X domain-containing protein 2 isoform X2 [Lethenteron reissneri]
MGQEESAPVKHADWMSSLPERLLDVKLRHLAIPGSHNSFSFGITHESPVGLDLSGEIRDLLGTAASLLGSAGEAVPRYAVQSWAVTQALTFREQLEAGVRYLDLRLAAHDCGDDSDEEKEEDDDDGNDDDSGGGSGVGGGGGGGGNGGGDGGSSGDSEGSNKPGDGGDAGAGGGGGGGGGGDGDDSEAGAGGSSGRTARDSEGRGGGGVGGSGGVGGDGGGGGGGGDGDGGGAAAAGGDGRGVGVHFTHGLLAGPVWRGLREVGAFARAHPREVLLLEFKHHYGLGERHHRLVLAALRRHLGLHRICPRSEAADASLRTLWERGRQVIVFYDGRALDEEDLCPLTMIRSPWPNTDDVERAVAFLDEVAARGPASDAAYRVAQLVLTPSTSRPGLQLLYGSLRASLVQPNMPTLVAWLKSQRAGPQGVNIVIADFVELSDFIPSVIALNDAL